MAVQHQKLQRFHRSTANVWQICIYSLLANYQRTVYDENFYTAIAEAMVNLITHISEILSFTENIVEYTDWIPPSNKKRKLPINGTTVVDR